jgi:hypothetical protein
MALLYADEDFHYGVVQRLRNLGHDVVTVQEAGRDGGNDPQVLADVPQQQTVRSCRSTAVTSFGCIA